MGVDPPRFIDLGLSAAVPQNHAIANRNEEESFEQIGTNKSDEPNESDEGTPQGKWGNGMPPP
jgi:hypothetical protein